MNNFVTTAVERYTPIVLLLIVIGVVAINLVALLSLRKDVESLKLEVMALQAENEDLTFATGLCAEQVNVLITGANEETQSRAIEVKAAHWSKRLQPPGEPAAVYED